MRSAGVERTALVLAAILWCWSIAGRAQTNTGEIGGVVRDSQNAVLPGARVVITHAASGFTAERVTDTDGRFFWSALRVGEWTITAERPGFAPQTRRGVILEIGRRLELELTLAIGTISEAVTVVSDASLLQSTTAEISDVIENREVVELPLNGRNFLGLAQLSDSVVIPPGGTRGEALQQAGPLPNVGGQRSGHNIYLLDGVKVTDELFNNLVINPSIDSIQEVKIQKSMYPPEFGGKASALINVATKAGTNRWDGSLFGFGRHDALDARNFFDSPGAPKPPLRQAQFGGSLGGPIRRDTAFLFVSYERLDGRRSLTRTFSVPPANVRAGDLSGLAPICDPLTRGADDRCAAFTGNQIPAHRLDPIAAALLARVPLPTSSGAVQNLTAIEPQTKRTDQFSVRVDQRIGDADQLFARVSTFEADEIQPFGSSALQETLVPGFGRSVETSTRNAAISHTHVWSGNVLNELRIGYLRVAGGQISLNRGNDFASRAGLRGVTSDPRDVGFPQISTGGLYSAMGDPTSFTFRENEHVELYENVLVDRGRHRLKFGGYVFHLTFRPDQPDNARGAFTYTGQWTGNAFADFLLGYPSSAIGGIGRGDENGRTNWLHLFAQDDWRPRDNLTLNLGLRYELNQHMQSVDNRLSSVDLSMPGARLVIASDEHGRIHPDANALLPLVPIPVVTTAEIGWNRGLLSPSRVRLAPRVGFALTQADGRAVVRGGYGIFLNQWAYSVQTAFARNLPFFFAKQVDVPADATTPTQTTRDILTTRATGTIGASIMDYDYRVEYTQTWSGGVQYQVFASTMVEASYMGSWTLGADNATVHNVPVPGPGAIQSRRPIPELSAIRAIRFDGQSIYHAATFRIERRLRRDHAFGVSYTLSSSSDDASSPGATEAEANVPQDVRNIFDGEWAPSSFDRRHQLVASATYVLPFHSSGGWLMRALANGWRVNGIAAVQSGAPFTVNIGQDRANIGAGPAQRPDQVRGPNLPRQARTADRWFDTGAFALQSPFTFGSAPRNSVLGPGFATVDVAIARALTLSGGSALELRWEVFNLLNRANFDLPNRTFGTPGFGRIFSAKSPREMQLGLRLRF